MALPAAQGLAVVYSLAEEWMWRRDVLTLLGAEDPERLDTVLAGIGPAPRGAARAQQIADMVTAMGGETGGG